MTASPDFADVAAELGLSLSRMVGPSKSGYHRLHPDHAVVFNATIADEDGNRLWWGDVDLTDDEATLLELAQRVEIDLYLYFEPTELSGERLWVIGACTDDIALDPAIHRSRAPRRGDRVCRAI